MIARGRDAQTACRITRAAGAIALASAAASLAALGLLGAGTANLIAVEGVGFAFRLDALSVVVFSVIAFVGHLVLRYSDTYLDGNPRQATFMAELALTLAAAILMTTAGNLLQLVLGWVATSLALHRLLLFFPERPRARAAARKKFIVARAGDACLAGAAVLLWHAYGTADIATMLDAARSASLTPAGVQVACCLIAVAAILKSAQFPTHGWLTEVMETPTPVSALLHAGIVNAGGFLVFRFADVFVLSPGAMQLLLIVGGFTALFGSVVMTAQTSIKVSLGYSTVGQMGFMLMQCGFGAFASAALHLVAHSLYKAHAFLNSGTAVDQARTNRDVAGDASPPLPMLVVALGMALATYLGVGALFGHPATSVLAVQTLGAIFVMGLFVFLARGAGARATLQRVVPGAAIAAALYFSLQIGAARLFASQVPAVPDPGLTGKLLAALVLASFAVVTVLQVAPAAASARWHRAAYVHLRNGLYANAVFNRLTGVIRNDAAR